MDNKFSSALSSLNIHYISIMKVSSTGFWSEVLETKEHTTTAGIYLWIFATDTLQVLCFGFRGCKFIASRRLETLCARWPFWRTMINDKLWLHKPIVRRYLNTVAAYLSLTAYRLHRYKIINIKDTKCTRSAWSFALFFTLNSSASSFEFVIATPRNETTVVNND